jgi:hypothetical protein
MDDNGQVYVYDSNSTYINGFVATPFTVTCIGAFDNVASGSGHNYEATGGYLSIFVGGSDSITQTTNVIYQIIPAVVVLCVLGFLIRFFKSFKI